MSQISKKQEAAIEALLSQDTIAAAATAAGIDRKTLARWLRDKSFRGRLREARADAFDHAMSRLSHGANDAVTILLLALRAQPLNGKAITRLQVLSARIILDHAAAGRADDIEQRLAELESALIGGLP